MPARTVVIEQLDKWDGQTHQLLTPGQFTQLTGRAGRRGLDTVGHAVVAYQRQTDFSTVAALVGRRVEPLRSSFTPTYNMAVNLLRLRTLAECEALLEQSFAQYQATAAVARSTDRIAENDAALGEYAQHLVSDRGDATEYLALRRELRDLERGGARRRRDERRRAVLDVLESLDEGDVITLAGDGVGAVVGAAGTARAQVVTDDRKLIRLHPQQFRQPPTVLGRITLPTSGGPRSAAYRRRVADALADTTPPDPQPTSSDNGDTDRQARIAQLRAAVHEHPVHTDERLPDIERWAARYDDLATRTQTLRRDVERRTGSLARELRRIVGVLTGLGYLEGPPPDPHPTALGTRLAGLYADTDLLLVECIRADVLAELRDADLAAVVSVFVHESRTKHPLPPWFPTPVIEERVARVDEAWEMLSASETAAGLTPTRAPDAGLCGQVWQWARGGDLDDVLGGGDLTGGDFVRGVKQIADLCQQLAAAYADTDLGTRALRTADHLLRGVVLEG
jgi:ATP-dependent RNA helicase HelY